MKMKNETLQMEKDKEIKHNKKEEISFDRESAWCMFIGLGAGGGGRTLSNESYGLGDILMQSAFCLFGLCLCFFLFLFLSKQRSLVKINNIWHYVFEFEWFDNILSSGNGMENMDDNWLSRETPKASHGTLSWAEQFCSIQLGHK